MSLSKGSLALFLWQAAERVNKNETLPVRI